MKLILRWAACVAALFLAAVIAPEGVVLSGGWGAAAAAGTVLFLFNLFVKPVAALITLPLSCLTVGLFMVLVNVGMVWFTGLIVPVVDFTSFWAMLLVALLVSAVNIVINAAWKDLRPA